MIGVDDRGNIVGTPDVSQEISDVVQSISPPPRFRVYKHVVNGKLVLVIEVEEIKEIHSYRYVTYIRSGRNVRPLQASEIVSLAAERLLINFDQQKCTRADISDINRDYVEMYLEARRRNRGVDIPRLPYRRILEVIGATVNGKPTNAGILFFSDRPQDLIPNAYVRLIVFRGEDMLEYMDRRDFSGPLWKIVEDFENYMMQYMAKMGAIVGFRRIEKYEYPLEALREALVNALTHRNYFDPGDVRVFIYPFKIVFINPGSFPPGVSPDKPTHKPRNPILSQYMYDMGFMEKYGVGIIRMKQLCAASRIKLTYSLDSFETRLTFSRIVATLDDIERKIMDLVAEESLSSSQLASRLGVSKDTVLRRINRLIQLDLVKRIGYGKSTRYIANL